MKKIFIVICLAMLALAACNKDETMVNLTSDATPAMITSPSTGFAMNITADNLVDTLSVTWRKVDYGVATEVLYTLEGDSKCGDFSNPIVLATATSKGALSLAIADLNTKLLDNIKTAQHQKADIQLRIISTVNGKYLTTSDPILISVTPYGDKPLGLWIGEGSSTAPVLYRTAPSLYEGYRYLTVGSFKFTNNPVCADSVFGSSSTAGQLAMGTSAGNIEVSEDGYYKINVDTENLTYTLVPIQSWGLVGPATLSGSDEGWNHSVAMSDDQSAGIWTKTLELTAGAVKFRANNEWVVNYGVVDYNALKGELVFDGPAIDIKNDGRYVVTLDFSQTKAPYKYTYSVVSAGDLQEPAKLWIPGGYQGYMPALAPTIYAVTSVAYEGYVYIGSATGYKFTSAPDWNNTNYGDAGTPNKLSIDGQAVDLSLASAGYYKFNVNTDKLTYSAELISTFGLVGPATQGGADAGWNTSVPMDYNTTTNLWTKTLDLSPGAVKVRANNDWPINYGPADTNALTGELVFNDPGAIDIKEAGSYTVTLDFTKAEPPYTYSYTFKKN